jgi:hypothetical protein
MLLRILFTLCCSLLSAADKQTYIYKTVGELKGAHGGPDLPERADRTELSRAAQRACGEGRDATARRWRSLRREVN